MYPEELIKRIQLAQPLGADAPHFDYALYVRLVRKKREWSREQLAEKAKLDPQFLTYLENNLSLPDELTAEARQKIEEALGVSYEKFRKINKQVMEDLKQSTDDLTESYNATGVNVSR